MLSPLLHENQDYLVIDLERKQMPILELSLLHLGFVSHQPEDLPLSWVNEA